MSEAGQRAILKRAAQAPELVAEISPVVAAGFGVLALRRLGDTLTVACFPHANRRGLRVLRDVLGLEIMASPFDERLLHTALRDAYFTDQESVNLPTFLDEDFLEQPGAAEALREEKVERVPAGRCELPAESVVLGELTYRSVLTNLDRHAEGAALPDPARLRLVLGDLDLAWTTEAGQARSCEQVPDEVHLLLNEFRFTTYQRGLGAMQASEHLVRASRVSDLPHVLHATEIQVVGIDRDGALRCHVYDRLERVPVDQPTRLSVTYHFLSYGNRLRRSIEVDVHALRLTTRQQLAIAEGSAWGPRELGRWLDLSRSGSMSTDSGQAGSNRHG
jgi:hypothetical protein